MDYKKFAVGSVVGAIVYFLLGWLLYGILFKDIYPQHPELSHTMFFIFLGCLFFAMLLAYVFTKWASITTCLTGAKAGAVLGLLYSASMNFFMYSGMEINYQNMFLDMVLTLISGGITGAAIAYVVGKLK